MAIDIKDIESNPALDFALGYEFPPYSCESGLERIVTQGDKSHKCPVYVNRVPPCSAGCPAGEDIRGYHNILSGLDEKDNKWAAAWELIVDKNPFPAVMGRVCPAPCESKCNRQYHDETIGINAVEHAIGNYGLENHLSFQRPKANTGKSVAVIGAGPAGLSAAYQLARNGHSVTIFEAMKKLGGMMRYGIMGYRVAREVLDVEIKRILDLGIEVKTGVRIGADISLDDLREKHDAVFIGVGAQKGRLLPIPGFGESEYTVSAVQFLIDFEKNGDKAKIGKKVLVLGDGDVAMDVARLALRMGSEATVLSAVPREDMKCLDFEFEETGREGAEIKYKISAVEVLHGNDHQVLGIKCVKMEKKEKGEEGWNSPIPFLRYKPISGSEFELQGDMVVASIGQATDMSGLEETTKGTPYLQVDHNYKIKGMDGVFGGGDAINIDLITTAIGHGRKAAVAIELYMKGKPLPAKTRPDVVEFDRLHPYYFEKSAQTKRQHKHVEVVKDNFQELLEPLQPDTAIGESERCMSCGLCFSCRQCLLYCPQEAIKIFRKNPIGEVMYTDYTKCVGCHICSDVCPCGYIDMGMGEDL